MSKSTPDNGYVISFLTLRKTVGILGMALPFVLIVGYLLFEKGCKFPPSISHFYYTNMGNLFVGVLCAVSLFLFAYNGYDEKDKWSAKLGGLFAACVAMFPTDYNSYAIIDCSRIARVENAFFNTMHYAASVLLFLTFAYFSLFLFTKSKQTGEVKGNKLIRNRIYITCGIIIVVSISGIAIIGIVPKWYDALAHLKPIFSLETVALLAFGYSWLIKGETFFKDE
jgi:hypothetical protein